MKNNIITLSILLTALFYFSTTTVQASDENDSSNVTVSFQNLETGEFVDDNYKIITNNTYEVENPLEQRSVAKLFSNVGGGDVESYITDLEIEYYIPDDDNPTSVTPFAQGDDETNSTGAVRVLARINFDVVGNNVRVNSGSSRFALTNSQAYMTNRKIYIQQGFNNSLTKNPTSNALTTYTTGWGYVTNYGGSATAKTMVTGIVNIGGMSSYAVSATAKVKN